MKYYNWRVAALLANCYRQTQTYLVHPFVGFSQALKIKADCSSSPFIALSLTLSLNLLRSWTVRSRNLLSFSRMKFNVVILMLLYDLTFPLSFSIFNFRLFIYLNVSSLIVAGFSFVNVEDLAQIYFHVRSAYAFCGVMNS